MKNKLLLIKVLNLASEALWAITVKKSLLNTNIVLLMFFQVFKIMKNLCLLLSGRYLGACLYALAQSSRLGLVINGSRCDFG